MNEQNFREHYMSLLQAEKQVILSNIQKNFELLADIERREAELVSHLQEENELLRMTIETNGCSDKTSSSFEELLETCTHIEKAVLEKVGCTDYWLARSILYELRKND